MRRSFGARYWSLVVQEQRFVKNPGCRKNKPGLVRITISRGAKGGRTFTRRESACSSLVHVSRRNRDFSTEVPIRKKDNANITILLVCHLAKSSWILQVVDSKHVTHNHAQKLHGSGRDYACRSRATLQCEGPRAAHRDRLTARFAVFGVRSSSLTNLRTSNIEH